MPVTGIGIWIACPLPNRERDNTMKNVNNQTCCTDDDGEKLPNWREVNKKIREENEREKEAARRRQTGEGLHIDLLQDVRRRHAGDPRRQIASFLARAMLPAATGRRREVSEKTRSDYSAILQQCVTDLAECGHPLNNLTDLGRKHVISLMRHWEQKENGETTIACKISILRRFFTLVGKTHHIPKGRAWINVLKQNGLVAGTIGRIYIPELPKGWVDMGIDPAPLIEAIRKVEPVVASNLEMMWGFGLRVNEAVQIQPAASDKGDYLLVHRGTKGGKVREVKFSALAEKCAWQRQILERAKVLANKHPKGVLAIKGMDLQHMKHRVSYVCRQHGVAKAGLGITLHGLRHQFGTSLFTDLCGLPAPVLQAIPPDEYTRFSAQVKAAFLEVSRQMGHERPGISGAYLSTVPVMRRLERARLEKWLGEFAGCTDAFLAAGVAEAWLWGKCASGLALPDGTAIQVVVSVPSFDGNVVQRLQELASTLSAEVKQRVCVIHWTEVNRPDDAAEILFARR